MKNMRDTVIVSACRTPIGAFGGSLRKVQAPVLAAGVMKEAIKRAGMEELVNEIQDTLISLRKEIVDIDTQISKYTKKELKLLNLDFERIIIETTDN